MILPRFYLPAPNSDGVFAGKNVSKDFVEWVSLYEFELFKDNEQRAYFSLANKPSAMRQALERWDLYIRPACNSESYYTNDTKSIKTIEKGLAAFQVSNGNWKIVRKASIEYLNSEVEVEPEEKTIVEEKAIVEEKTIVEEKAVGAEAATTAATAVEETIAVKAAEDEQKFHTLQLQVRRIKEDQEKLAERLIVPPLRKSRWPWIAALIVIIVAGLVGFFAWSDMMSKEATEYRLEAEASAAKAKEAAAAARMVVSSVKKEINCKNADNDCIGTREFEMINGMGDVAKCKIQVKTATKEQAFDMLAVGEKLRIERFGKRKSGESLISLNIRNCQIIKDRQFGE
jgi:hypothetical protein